MAGVCLALFLPKEIEGAMTLSYQGRLSYPNGTLRTGTYCFYFEMFTSQTEGSPTWAEEWCSGTEAVVISTARPGVFQVDLGKYTGLPVFNFSTDYYLQISVKPIGGSYETLSPRNKIGGAAISKNAVYLNGRPSSYYLDAANLSGTLPITISADFLSLSSSPTVIGDWTYTGSVTITDSLDLTGAVVSGLAALSITDSDISNWDTAYGWGSHSVAGYITAGSSNVLTNKSGNISMWTNNSGYLTSYSETDPVYSIAPASGITNGNILNWNTAYGWGDYSTQGYITASSSNVLTNKTWNGNEIGDAYISNSITASNYLPLAGGTMNGNIILSDNGWIGNGNGVNQPFLTFDDSNNFFEFSGGSVGIGTATPSTALDVNGIITATTFSGSGASLANIPETAISDGSILARVGSSETISGAWTFSSEPSLAGGGRHARTIHLNAEYSGAVLTTFYGSGTDASITGTITADTETSGNNLRNYYEWTSDESALNYYTVAVRIALPGDFDAWAESNAIQIDYVTESTSDNSSASVYIFNGDDTPALAVAASTGNASISWTTISIDDSAIDDGAAPDWDAAGETAVIYLRMGARNSNTVRFGDIKLNYLSKW